MKKIGQEIKDLRKSKGLSQEELAMQANVNVRTIQRIEANENSPHGKTLQLICEALDIQPNDILQVNKIENNSLLMWMYFSVGAMFVLPLGNIILPLLLWLANKHQVILVNKVGKNIVYNQTIISIVVWVFLIGGVLTNSTYGILIGLVIAMINVIFSAYAGIKANQGKIILYPFI